MVLVGGGACGLDTGIGESVMESFAASKNIWDLGERVWDWGWVGVGVFCEL